MQPALRDVQHSTKFTQGISIIRVTLGDEAKQSLYHPPMKLVRLQVQEDMMQIINITDFLPLFLGVCSLKIGTNVSFLRCSVFYGQFTNLN